MADEGAVVGTASVRLRPSTTNFAAEAAATLDPELAAVEGKINASSGRVGNALKGLSTNLGSFGIPFAGALDSVDRSLEKTAGNAGNAAAKISSFGGLEVVALGAVGAASVEMAQSAEGAQARLQSALANTHESYAQYKGAIEDTESSQRKLGFTDVDTDNSLAKLINTTKSVGEATKDEALAADISAGRKISLSAATDLLVKVETGHVSLLGRYGIATKDATGATISQQEAIQRLTDTYGGDAQRAADTFVGELRTLGAEGEHVGVVMGEHVIPVIQDFAHAGAVGIEAIEGLNRSTNGWLGSVTLVAAAVPIAVFAGEKLWNVGGLIVNQYGKVVDGLSRTAQSLGITSTAEDALAGATAAGTQVQVASAGERATAQETVAAAIAQRVAAQAAANTADVAAVAESTAVITSTDLRVAAEMAEVDAEAALLRARAFAVNASVAEGSANEALTAVQDELTASWELSDAALTKLNVTSAAATEAALAAAAADEVEATAVATLAAAEETAAAARASEAASQLGESGEGLGGTGAGIVVVGVAATVAIGAGLALGDALRHLGGDAELTDGQIKALTNDLVKGGDAAEQARGQFSKVLGPEASTDLQHYTNLLLANASSTEVNAAKSKVMADALAQIPHYLQAVAAEGKNAADSSAEFQSQVGAVTTNVNKATSSIAALTKQYGASAIQSAERSAAEKQYRDDLTLVATGADDSGAAHKRLAADKRAVTEASRLQAGVEKQVSEATGESTASTSAATTPLQKYNALLDGFITAARSGSTVAGQLSKDWSDVEAAAGNSASTQAMLTSVLDQIGISATVAAGDVVSLSMAEASLGNYSANAVSSAKNLSDAAFEQSDANQKVASSSDAYKTAVDGLSKAQSGGGGGGAAGATKTATAAILDQEQKSLALRDALRQEAGVAQAITVAQEQLTTARHDAHQADLDVAAAELNYTTVLHGVSAASRQAIDATEDLTKAKLDSQSRRLDVGDAQRALDEAMNNSALNAFGVTDAQTTLTAAQQDAATKSAALGTAESTLATLRASGTASTTDIATAEAALNTARTDSATANEQVTKDEVALANARIDATKGDEDIERAEIALKQAKLAVHDATTSQTTAEKTYEGVLDGYPAKSAQAKAAHHDLVVAKQADEQASNQLITAEQGVQTAQDNTATSALGVFRALADVEGKLNNSPSAASTANKAFDTVQSKLNTVRDAAKTYAESIRDQVTQTYALPQAGIYAELKLLEDLSVTNPLLKASFASVIAGLSKELTTLGPIPVDLLGPSNVTGLNATPHASGGHMRPGQWGTAGEGNATELLHVTNDGVDIFSHAQSQSMVGGGPSAADIVRMLVPYLKPGLTVQTGDLIALDPETLAHKTARKVSFQLAGKLG